MIALTETAVGQVEHAIYLKLLLAEQVLDPLAITVESAPKATDVAINVIATIAVMIVVLIVEIPMMTSLALVEIASQPSAILMGAVVGGADQAISQTAGVGRTW